MNTVTLHDGSIVPEPVVHTTVMTLNVLTGGPLTDHLAVADLVALARGEIDPNDVGSQERDRLQEVSLLSENGTLHVAVRDVVRNSAVGDVLALSFVNPVRGVTA